MKMIKVTRGKLSVKVRFALLPMYQRVGWRVSPKSVKKTKLTEKDKVNNDGND